MSSLTSYFLVSYLYTVELQSNVYYVVAVALHVYSVHLPIATAYTSTASPALNACLLFVHTGTSDHCLLEMTSHQDSAAYVKRLCKAQS